MSRIAWVTGASRGIGRAIAMRLAAGGHDVAVGYHRSADEARKVCAEAERLDVRAIAVAGDLGDADAVVAAHREVVERLGPVAVLALNHGVYERGDLAEIDAARWQRTIDVDLTAAYLAARAVAPAMRSAGWGRIVFIGSVRGRTGSAHGADYATAKAGLLGLARSLARELGPHGVTVNLVAPGQIATDILAGDTSEKRRARERAVPVGRIGTPEDVAAAVAFLVSEDASYVTGVELRVDGGFEMG